MTTSARALLRARARERRRRPLLLWVAAAALVALILGFVLAGPIERALVTAQARAVTGVPVRIGSVRHEGQTLVLSDVAFTGVNDMLRVTIPKARVLRDKASVRVSISGATVDVIAGGVIAMSMHDVAGTVQFGAKKPSYAVRGIIGSGIDGGAVVGTGTLGAGGRLEQHWSAVTIPIAALRNVFSPRSGIVAHGGVLRDIAVEDVDGSLSGSAHVEDGAFAVNGYKLTGLHGELRLGNRAIGTPKLLGTFDGYPLTISGEVDDLPTRFAWIRKGSSDLRSLAWLLERIAAQQKVTSIDLKTIAPGLVFAQFGVQTANGPVAVSLERMDRANKTLRFDTALASDHIFSGGERTSTLGVRTGAVAGLNGDYFDIGATYQPQGLLISHGEMLHSPGTRAAIVIDRQNRIAIDDYTLEGQAVSAEHSFRITQVNWWPAGDVTVITPSFGKEIPPAPHTVFAQLTPVAGAVNRYRVERITPCNAAIPTTFGLAFGPKTRGRVHVGEVLDVSYRLSPQVPDAVAAIGGGPWLLRDGAWYEDPRAPAPDERDVRWPVDAIGLQRDGHLLLAAVDGRHPERSIGMTRPEFGTLLLDFDVTDAFALDSGGSVTMIGRAPGDATATLRNVPSDDSAERWVSDALLVYSTAPAARLFPPSAAPTPVPEARPTP